MGVAAIFLDAGYLSKVLWHDHANARIDFSKLALEMAEPDQLLRAYYYNCLPYQGNRLPRTSRSAIRPCTGLSRHCGIFPALRLGWDG
jgi:hypothetical protein